MRYVFVLALTALLLPVAALAEPSTTRIETRPFYGATVTLEAGVRVYRPLPPNDRVIINPNGATPLALGFEQRNVESHNYNYSSAAPGASATAESTSGAPYGAYGYGRAPGHHPHHKGGHGVPGHAVPGVPGGVGGHR